MFGIGMPELIVVFLVALVVLGPKKLPHIARAIGRGIMQFKRAMNALDDDASGEDDDSWTDARDEEESEKERSVSDRERRCDQG